MRLYVINLDRAQKRWTHIEEQFSQLGLEAFRVAAIDGQHLSEAEMKLYRQGHFRLLYDSEIACFLSHRKCWQMIAEGRDEYACVFEDDIYISPYLPDFLNSSMWVGHVELLSLERFEPVLPVFPQPIHAQGGYEIYRCVGDNPGTGGYLLSKEFAKILLAHSAPFFDLVDAYAFSVRNDISFLYGSYQLSPALCLQSDKIAGQGLGEKMAQTATVFSTSQEAKTRFSALAQKQSKNLHYYMQQMRILYKYYKERRKQILLPIAFKE